VAQPEEVRNFESKEGVSPTLAVPMRNLEILAVTCKLDLRDN
jgi:hypothetical protein